MWYRERGVPFPLPAGYVLANAGENRPLLAQGHSAGHIHPVALDLEVPFYTGMLQPAVTQPLLSSGLLCPQGLSIYNFFRFLKVSGSPLLQPVKVPMSGHYNPQPTNPSALLWDA